MEDYINVIGSQGAGVPFWICLAESPEVGRVDCILWVKQGGASAKTANEKPNNKKETKT
jgi:hypothetical protein